MYTEEVLAIYINLINMVDAFINLQMDLIFSIENYYEKKDLYEIFCVCIQMAKFLKGNRFLANALPIYSFTFIFVLFN